MPTPFTRATYYHRSINPKKLIEVKFSALTQNQTLPMVKKLYAIPDELSLDLKPMTKHDVFGVAKLLNEGLSYMKNNVENTWWSSTTLTKTSNTTFCQETKLSTPTLSARPKSKTERKRQKSQISFPSTLCLPTSWATPNTTCSTYMTPHPGLLLIFQLCHHGFVRRVDKKCSNFSQEGRLRRLQLSQPYGQRFGILESSLPDRRRSAELLFIQLGHEKT